VFIVDVVVRANDELIDTLLDEGIVHWAEDGYFIAPFDLYEGRKYWVVILEDPLDPFPEENTGVYVPKVVPKSLVPVVALYAIAIADRDYWNLYADTPEFQNTLKEIVSAVKQAVPSIQGRVVDVEKSENAVTVRIWW